MARNDPIRNMRFRVEIDQITQAYFSEVAIGETTNEAIDYREGIDPTHVRKIPGPSVRSVLKAFRRSSSAGSTTHTWMEPSWRTSFVPAHSLGLSAV